MYTKFTFDEPAQRRWTRIIKIGERYEFLLEECKDDANEINHIVSRSEWKYITSKANKSKQKVLPKLAVWPSKVKTFYKWNYSYSNSAVKCTLFGQFETF